MANERFRTTVDETTLGGLLVFTAAAGFGTLAIFGKLAIVVGLSLESLLLFRFIVAAVLMWVALYALGRARLLTGRSLVLALGIGVVYALMTWLFFEGLKSLTAGVAAIVFYTYPVHVFAISAVVLHEPMTRLKLVACGVALAGVILLIGGAPTGVHPLGIGLVLLAAIGYATYSTASRATLGTVEAGHLTANAIVATAVSMVPLGLLSGGLAVPVGIQQWSIVLGIAIVGTAIPIGLFVGGLEHIEASHASIIGTSEPLVTMLLGVLLLGEVLTPTTVVGGGLILAGVLIIQREGQVSVMVAH